MSVVRVAILGSGNIGCDILAKILKAPYLSCTQFVGRNHQSAGLRYAAERGIVVLGGGLQALLDQVHEFDLVFDATSASAHLEHAPVLQRCGKTVINLTPAPLGEWCVPVINADAVLASANINMVTCGGQAALPILHAIKRIHPRLEYIEVVSSIAARSAGAATRMNIDEYLNTTQRAIADFTGCRQVKAILNINPAVPCVSMQTAVSVLLEKADVQEIRGAVENVVSEVRQYVPGYKLAVEPYLEGKRVFTMAKVTGLGDFLPSYAGNLDIITSAAVRVAEQLSRRRDPAGVVRSAS